MNDLALFSDFENYHWTLLGLAKKNFKRKNFPPLPHSSLSLRWKKRIFCIEKSSYRCACARKWKLTVIRRSRLYSRHFSKFFSQCVRRNEPKEVHEFFFLIVYFSGYLFLKYLFLHFQRWVVSKIGKNSERWEYFKIWSIKIDLKLNERFTNEKNPLQKCPIQIWLRALLCYYFVNFWKYE